MGNQGRMRSSGGITMIVGAPDSPSRPDYNNQLPVPLTAKLAVLEHFQVFQALKSVISVLTSSIVTETGRN